MISRSALVLMTATAVTSSLWACALPVRCESPGSRVAIAAASANVDTRAALRTIRTAAMKIKRTTLEVINDVTQRKLLDETGDPLFFEPTDHQVEKDPSLWAKEQTNWSGIEPPRKSWLDADVKHLDHWVTALNSDIASVPAEKQTAMGEPWQQLQSLARDINSHTEQLKELSKGPNYDNTAIAKAALVIHEDLKKMEAPWKAAMGKGKATP